MIFAHWVSKEKLGMKKIAPSLGNRNSSRLLPLKWNYVMEYMHVEYRQTETKINWIIQDFG